MIVGTSIMREYKSKSCDHCKLKKIKCDQTQPKCLKCSKIGIPCVYSVKKKPGLRKGYGQQMIDQLAELESELTSSRDQLQLQIDNLNQERLHQSNEIRDLNRKIGLLSKPNSNHELDTFSSTRDDIDKTDHTHSFEESVLASDSTDEALPSAEQIEWMVMQYFNFVHPIFPVLHPSLSRGKLSTHAEYYSVLLGVLLNSLRFSGSAMNENEAKRYESSFRAKILTECFGVKDINELTAMALLTFHSYSTSNNPETWSLVSIITNGCIHLELLNEPSKRNHTNHHRNPEQAIKRQKLDTGEYNSELVWNKWADEETQRNLFWEIYALDKLTSVASFFSAKLTDKDIGRYLPLNYNFWEVESLFDSHFVLTGQTRTLWDKKATDEVLYDTNSYIIEVLHLMGSIQEFMKNPIIPNSVKSVLNWEIAFTDLEEKIKNWRDTFPKSYNTFLESKDFSLDKQITIKDVIFHSLYHTMLIRLNSAIAFPASNEKPMFSVEKARIRCKTSGLILVESFKKLPQIFPEYGDSIFQYMGPYCAFTLWVCGRVLLVDSIYSKAPIPSELEDVVDILRNIGAAWNCAIKYADILELFKNDDDFAMSYNSSRSQEAQLITDMTLHAASLEALLSRKIDQYKADKGSPVHNNDLVIFDWFKFPVDENLLPPNI